MTTSAMPQNGIRRTIRIRSSAAPGFHVRAVVFAVVSLSLSSLHPVSAWMPKNNQYSYTAYSVMRHQSEAVQGLFATTMESEWYSPPPAAKEEIAPTKLPAGVKPLMHTIRSTQDLHDLIHADDDRLLIVKFHASWCKSCLKFSRKFDQLALQQADWVQQHTPEERVVVKRGRVRLAQVEWSQNKALCQQLGIASLPTVHVVQRGKKLQEFECPPSQFHRVQEAIRYYSGDNHEPNDESELLTDGELQQQQRLDERVLQQEEETLARGHHLIQDLVPQLAHQQREGQQRSGTLLSEVASAVVANEVQSSPASAPKKRRRWFDRA